MNRMILALLFFAFISCEDDGSINPCEDQTHFDIRVDFSLILDEEDYQNVETVELFIENFEDAHRQIFKNSEHELDSGGMISTSLCLDIPSTDSIYMGLILIGSNVNSFSNHIVYLKEPIELNESNSITKTISAIDLWEHPDCNSMPFNFINPEAFEANINYSACVEGSPNTCNEGSTGNLTLEALKMEIENDLLGYYEVFGCPCSRFTVEFD
jgi:hypothetical protein